MHIRGGPVVQSLHARVRVEGVGGVMYMCMCLNVCVCVCAFDVMFVHSVVAMASSLTPDA